MANVSATGSVASLWRYPVKSMQGEELGETEVTECGLLGDRAYALIDQQDGKAASAKNTRGWPNIFAYRAAYLEPTALDDGDSVAARPVRITLPSGRNLTSDQADVHELLSLEFGRELRLQGRERDQRRVRQAAHDSKAPRLADSRPETGRLEEHEPNSERLAEAERGSDKGPPADTYFDLAVVHLLTTATLERLSELYPGGRFDVRRYRPNVVVQTDVLSGFVENDWVGRTLRIGDSLRLQVTAHCPRCVMTTLPQADLPNDPGILRTAAKHNEVNVGVYARVLQRGTVRRRDALELEE
ncbi:MAG: MOSC N-terminal beta barrel domain-containing protein [Trueperaceae bacterium]